MSTAFSPLTIASVSTPTWPSRMASCSWAAGREVSSEAMSTRLRSRSLRRLAIFAVVVVRPLQADHQHGHRRRRLEVERHGLAAKRVDHGVMHDLDHHLPGLDRPDDLLADRPLAHLVGERAHHLERHIGLDQCRRTSRIAASTSAPTASHARLACRICRKAVPAVSRTFCLLSYGSLKCLSHPRASIAGGC